jgi:hypothetical protein
MRRIICGGVARPAEDFFRAVNEATPALHCSFAARSEQWPPSPPARRSPVNSPSTRRALARFALVTAAAITAASLWAQNRPEQGLLIDALTWQEEVATASTGPWPDRGWYRLLAGDEGVEVKAVKPSDRDTIPVDAVFFRLPGTTLKTGPRASWRHLEVLQPRADRDHQLSLGRRFTLQVEEVDAGVQYAIGYGGRTYRYIVGPQGASTSVRAVADMDGDGRPDFLVDVAGRSTYLLLSTQAQPGVNLPTAEMPSARG